MGKGIIAGVFRVLLTIFIGFVSIPLLQARNILKALYQPLGKATGKDLTDYSRSTRLKKLGGELESTSIEVAAWGKLRDGQNGTITIGTGNTAKVVSDKSVLGAHATMFFSDYALPSPPDSFDTSGADGTLDPLATYLNALERVKRSQGNFGTSTGRAALEKFIGDKGQTAIDNSNLLKKVNEKRASTLKEVNAKIKSITDYKEALDAVNDPTQTDPAKIQEATEKLAAAKAALEEDLGLDEANKENREKGKGFPADSDNIVDADDVSKMEEQKEVDDMEEEERRRDRIRGAFAAIFGIMGAKAFRQYMCEETLNAAKKSGCFMYPYAPSANGDFISALSSPSKTPPDPPAPLKVNGTSVTLQKNSMDDV